MESVKATSAASSVAGEEMQQAEIVAYLSQLAHLVPTLALQHGQNVSHVQILQHVIDYIADLETELDMPLSQLQHQASSERRPLVENTNIVVSPHSQQVTCVHHYYIQLSPLSAAVCS
jgi:hypothetical protein